MILSGPLCVINPEKIAARIVTTAAKPYANEATTSGIRNNSVSYASRITSPASARPRKRPTGIAAKVKRANSPYKMKETSPRVKPRTRRVARSRFRSERAIDSGASVICNGFAERSAGILQSSRARQSTHEIAFRCPLRHRSTGSLPRVGRVDRPAQRNASHLDLAHASDRLALQKTISVNPQEFAEGSGIASIAPSIGVQILSPRLESRDSLPQ